MPPEKEAGRSPSSENVGPAGYLPPRSFPALLLVTGLLPDVLPGPEEMRLDTIPLLEREDKTYGRGS